MGVTNEQFEARIGMHDLLLPQCIQFTSIKMLDRAVYIWEWSDSIVN